MLECAQKDGFDEEQVKNSIEKKKTEYANNNIEASSYAANNRLLFLIPHTFHDSLMEKVLTEQLEKRETGNTNFCPGTFLRERILDQISSIQLLVFGNSSKE